MQLLPLVTCVPVKLTICDVVARAAAGGDVSHLVGHVWDSVEISEYTLDRGLMQAATNLQCVRVLERQLRTTQTWTRSCTPADITRMRVR